MTLPKSLQRFAGIIADYSDERDAGNPIFIGYKAGWKSSTDPLGCVHGDTADSVREALSLVRSAEPCSCVDCRPFRLGSL